MSSSLFSNANSDMIQMLSSLKSNPNEFFNLLLNRNPQFKKFIEDNKDKTPQQIANKYGVNINDLRNMLDLIK